MSRGFSLVELVVATAIVCSATIAVAQLPLLAMRTNELALRTTIATVLAAQKMEQLQSSAWTDLSTSPPFALDRNTDGFHDFIDEHARVIGSSASPPPGTAYVRRWGLEMVESAAVIIQVTVAPVSADEVMSRSARRPGEVRIVGVKSRS